jgi:hypothetical protein
VDLDLKLYANSLLNWLFEVQVPILLQHQKDEREENASRQATLREMHPQDERSEEERQGVIDNIWADDDRKNDPERDYVDVSDFLRPLGVGAYEGYKIVTHMRDKGLLEMGYYDLSFEVACEPPGESKQPSGDERYGKVLITGDGIEAAESNRRTWHDVLPQFMPLPQRLILWLGGQSGRSSEPMSLQNFLVSRHASFEGRPLFSARELQPVVSYFASKGLLEDLSEDTSDYSSGAVRLTEEGLECAVGYNGDAAAYLRRSG